MIRKVCPVLFRRRAAEIELLAFRHPDAGNQFVKGGIEPGESALEAATRELREESGIAVEDWAALGEESIGKTIWHFVAADTSGLPETWDHATEDDFGHVFSFFWHPLVADLDASWDGQFHEALAAIRGFLHP